MPGNRNQKSASLSPSLVKLGLTPDESKCYLYLVREGASDIKSLALGIHILPNAAYRLLNKLVRTGFVVRLDIYPVKYQAVPPQIAIAAYADEKLKEVIQLRTTSISDIELPKSNPQIGIDVITGDLALFQKSTEFTHLARKEVLIISIGESVSDDVKLANRDAISRGVNIKFIVHKYDAQNRILLESWQKMGLQIRYYAESGYHLVVVDGSQCLLSVSNPTSPAERTTMVIHSESLSLAMRNYFYSVWEKALPL